MDTENKKYVLSSVDSALSIMNLFYDNDELSVVEVAKLMNITRSKAFRYLNTLAYQNFLEKTEDNYFRLGMKIFTLGLIAESRMAIINSVRPLLEEIAKISGETTNLSIWNDSTRTMVIDKVLSNAQLKMDTVLGTRHYAHLTAGGKALLSFKDHSFINNYILKAKFQSLTPNTIVDIKQLLTAIDKIRQDGFSEDFEEAEIGLSCIGVPLFSGGKVIAAISVSGPSTRISANRDLIIDTALSASKKFSKKIISYPNSQ